MIFNSKEGFTLIELMVYIALLGGIVLIAGQAFSDSTKMRVRTQSMLQASQTAGNIGTILKDDIAQIGAKSSKETGGSTMDVFSTDHVHDVYMDPDAADDADKDSSSFTIVKNDDGDGRDKITMRRLRYSDAGTYQAVEEVIWYVDNHVLKRSCQSFEVVTEDAECPSENPNIVIIAEHVDKFSITPAKPSTTASSVSILPSSSEADKNFKLVPRFGDANFEPVTVDPEDGGTTIRLSGFSMNYNFTTSEPFTNPDMVKANQVFVSAIGNSESSWNNQCLKINLEPYIEYEISFTMPYSTTDDPSRMFCPGRDHMAVGFRYAENGNKLDGLSDFQFYPPTIGDERDTGLRKMRFTTSATYENVCLGFTFVSFSPVASSGNINISNVRLRKIPSSNYAFTNDAIATADKKNIKAIKFELSINKNGEAGTEIAVVSIPSNGPRD